MTAFKRNCCLIILLSCTACLSLKADNYKVLFLGNSYTGVNNLPQMVHDVALSAGDTLIFDSNTPGGYQLITHSSDATTQSKIAAGGWDYVVLQGQSQEPIIDFIDFYNGGYFLRSQVKQSNPCAVLMAYMTWGRKNGDPTYCPTFPSMCTYQGMDTTLRGKYLNFADYLNAEISPVSVVWNYLRQNYPAIELYQPDDSHPSMAGSYAAACSFYASIFKKDPTLITYDAGLNSADAAVIRSAAKTKVFNNWPAWDLKKAPVADLWYQIGTGNNEAIFQAITHGVQQTYFWDFGDGSTDSIMLPTHSYAANGTYTVSLTTTTCDLQGYHADMLDTVIQFCSHTPTIYTFDSLLCAHDTLWTQPADAYEWFLYNVPLLSNSQSLPDYMQYAPSGFTVRTTLNGCTELSKTYTESTQWPGYYFDAIGSPCNGDTVTFAVLHINGSLSGTESILWFKNDTLLASMTNEDTLLVTTEGTYQCKVVDPNTSCPLDTSSYTIVYNCSGIGVEETQPVQSWAIFPNPASTNITIQFTKLSKQELIEIYDAMGRVVKLATATAGATEINIADLPNGLYYVRLKNNPQPALKFIKL